VFALLALAGALALTGCGGGNGAPNNMFAPGGVAGPLAVLPATATVFSGVPSTLTITGGTAPFTAFSSNSAVLPVTQAVSDTTVPLLGASVAADETVQITIRDTNGQTVTVPVTVKPSLLLPASITITGNPVCGASGAQLCSGQDGTATVKVTGAAGAPAAGRQIQFDVVLGTFSLIATNSTVPAQSVTVTTDQNGQASVTIRVPSTAVSQFGTIRATDVASGSSVIGQFTIAQFVNGNSVLSVIPTGVTTFTGPDTQTCSSGGQATFYIFGGTPPYQVQTNFPTAVSLVGVPVLASGGGFTVVTNGTCFTNLTFAITDAAGRTLLTPPTVTNAFGTAPPPPTALQIFPSSGYTTASPCAGSTFPFAVAGGTPPYSVLISPSAGWTANPSSIPASGGQTQISGGAGAASTTVTFIDGSKPVRSMAAPINCT
jgi:hypothetical protein